MIGFGITTTIGTSASGTITVSVIGFGVTTVSISFVASGAGAALAISTPAGGDASGNLGANFADDEGAAYVVSLTDSAGAAVSGAGVLNAATLGNISVDQPEGGPLLVTSEGGDTTAMAGGLERALLSDAEMELPTLLSTLEEIGPSGTYSLGITTPAGTAAGPYAFTLSLKATRPWL